MQSSGSLDRPEQAAVAIIFDGDCLLTIKRSETVRAPGQYCFPGGGLEANESVEQALVREMREELNITVRPIRSLWTSTSPTGVELFWWVVEVEDGQEIMPNPAEVASIEWLTVDQIRRLPKLLASNVEFFESLAKGEFSL
ncbi:NUDIX domain-containing protein [Saprospiraceae bacterium]|nr:NUDIX domain-containing protein [Saprospiraceae bacterium]